LWGQSRGMTLRQATVGGTNAHVGNCHSNSAGLLGNGKCGPWQW